MTQYALLWSHQQNNVHVEPLERTLSLNRDSYRDNETVYYAPIAVGTLDEMLSAAEAIKPTLTKRQPAAANPRPKVEA